MGGLIIVYYIYMWVMSCVGYDDDDKNDDNVGYDDDDDDDDDNAPA